MQKRCVALAIGMSIALCAAAESPKTFRTRLAPVAIDVAMKANVAGSGSLTAVLAGSRLTRTTGSMACS